jgi:hypothetical protein
MYCPNCGKDTPADQKFCRGCGLRLEKVALAIAEQLPASGHQSSPEEIARLLRNRRRAERLIAVLGGAGLSVLVATIILLIVFKIMIGRGEYLGGGAFLALVVAAASALLLVFYRESLNASLARRGAPAEKSLPDTAPTARLLHESRIEPVPSVTDRTTELLAAEPRRDAREN